MTDRNQDTDSDTTDAQAAQTSASQHTQQSATETATGSGNTGSDDADASITAALDRILYGLPWAYNQPPHQSATYNIFPTTDDPDDITFTLDASAIAPHGGEWVVTRHDPAGGRGGEFIAGAQNAGVDAATAVDVLEDAVRESTPDPLGQQRAAATRQSDPDGDTEPTGDAGPQRPAPHDASDTELQQRVEQVEQQHGGQQSAGRQQAAAGGSSTSNHSPSPGSRPSQSTSPPRQSAVPATAATPTERLTSLLAVNPADTGILLQAGPAAALVALGAAAAVGALTSMWTVGFIAVLWGGLELAAASAQ